MTTTIVIYAYSDSDSNSNVIKVNWVLESGTDGRIQYYNDLYDFIIKNISQLDIDVDKFDFDGFHTESGSSLGQTKIMGFRGEMLTVPEEINSSLDHVSLTLKQENYDTVRYIKLYFNLAITNSDFDKYTFQFTDKRQPFVIEFPSQQLLDKLIKDKQILFRYDSNTGEHYKTPKGYYYILMYNHDKEQWEFGWASKKLLSDSNYTYCYKIIMEQVNEDFVQHDHNIKCIHCNYNQFWRFEDITDIFGERKY